MPSSPVTSSQVARAFYDAYREADPSGIEQLNVHAVAEGLRAAMKAAGVAGDWEPVGPQLIQERSR
jgi:hypothetical protein